MYINVNVKGKTCVLLQVRGIWTCFEKIWLHTDLKTLFHVSNLGFFSGCSSQASICYNFLSLQYKQTSNFLVPICLSGFDTDGLPSAVWPGGETEALTRLERHLERKVCFRSFKV